MRLLGWDTRLGVGGDGNGDDDDEENDVVALEPIAKVIYQFVHGEQENGDDDGDEKTSSNSNHEDVLTAWTRFDPCCPPSSDNSNEDADGAVVHRDNHRRRVGPTLPVQRGIRGIAHIDPTERRQLLPSRVGRDRAPQAGEQTRDGRGSGAAKHAAAAFVPEGWGNFRTTHQVGLCNSLTDGV